MITSNQVAAATQFNEELLEELRIAWKRSDAIFAMLEPDALATRPIPLRHPWIFYIGHLPAFAWNMLGNTVLKRTSPRPAFDRLFDFGIDPEDDAGLPEKATWPPLDEILRYRDDVRARFSACAADLAEVHDERLLAEHGRVLHVVIEHELMHHETLLYMFQEAQPSHKRRPVWWSLPAIGQAKADFEVLSIPAGKARVGANFDELAFGWDNEFPVRTFDVEAFRLGNLPVTNSDYLEFVEQGGYSQREWWSTEAWVWLQKHGRNAPQGWARSEPHAAGDDDWVVTTAFEPVPLQAACGWPVQVSLAEAEAYARWRGARLPTEPELYRAAYADTVEPSTERPYPWGDEEPDVTHGAFDFQRAGPSPVGSFPAGRSLFGAYELVGNGWEWTSTVFARHSGFKDYIEGYRGYSKDFFDGNHHVLFGGSSATDKRLLRRSFRNWFRTNYPYAFTKFRLAWDA